MKTHFAVISDEQHAVTWIDLAGAEVTRLDSHICAVVEPLGELIINYFRRIVSIQRGGFYRKGVCKGDDQRI